MYRVVFDKKILKFLKKHTGENIILLLENAISTLRKNPYTNNLDTTKLKGYKNIYRMRIGKYRLIYEIQDNTLTIFCLDIDSRGGIYKNF